MNVLKVLEAAGMLFCDSARIVRGSVIDDNDFGTEIGKNRGFLYWLKPCPRIAVC